MAGIFEYFVVCGLGPKIRTLDGNKGYHGMDVLYLASLLDQYPPSNHSLYPPPPPQLSTVSSTIQLHFFHFSLPMGFFPINLPMASFFIWFVWYLSLHSIAQEVSETMN